MAHRPCVSLNSRLESNKEEETSVGAEYVPAVLPGGRLFY